MTQERPLILVTNDDSIKAPGIRVLIEVMNQIGEVVVVAPDKPQSGKGHAISVDTVLTYERVQSDGPQVEYSCSGTPADCVKLAVHDILDRKPDLCVSGINHGANSSISVIYSGTMSAAIEAGIEGIPSIGFSLLDFSWDADFEKCKDVVKMLAKKVLAEGLEQGVVLNVNFPNQEEAFKGIKICRQAKGNWVEEFDKRVSPHGKTYYWLTGKFVNLDSGEDTDEYALSKGYVSVVPTQFDLTAHRAIEGLKNWNL
ncbi:MAG: 5'/3'-nucleotidase SurE [Flavobacteriaceae bacterium]